MRSRIVAVLICSSVVYSGPAVADNRAQPVAAIEQCNQFSQFDIRECLKKHATDSAAALKQAEARAAAAIASWDESDTYIKDAGIKLRAANASFVRDRQVQCAFASSLIGGGAGNSHEIKRLACVADMNARRTFQLDRDTGKLVPK
ncbi:DUF1311 domain-containing protein [Massilia sp. CCM 8692]|uniref:DUF1311 domain-containing protein n=1 Tax=Massilia rubra TaxID=2607910 RepID=A0ABX0LJW3_9BURK|nr:DUF1311 domain-containing protein [Massilia rubra]